MNNRTEGQERRTKSGKSQNFSLRRFTPKTVRIENRDDSAMRLKGICRGHVNLISYCFLCLSFIYIIRSNGANSANRSIARRGDRIPEVEEYVAWLEKCKHIFLDLGANRGDTILRWLTRTSYSGRAKTSSIDRMYDLKQRQNFCVLSFEPNEIFDATLLGIEKEMNQKGFKTKVILQTAVSDKFSESVIYLDDVSTHSYGTSLIADKKVNFGGHYHSLGKNQTVRLVSLSAILRSIPVFVEVVVKMDIEGAEYDVLRSLFSTGMACRIDVLMIEFHLHKLKKAQVPAGANEVIEWILKGNKCDVKVIYDD